MEVEAKFSLPDVDTCEQLQAIERLAGFELSPGQVEHVRDTYLDTADRLILSAGYAFRRREQAEGVLITLKSLQGAEGAIHRREELEALLPSDQQPAQWPAGPLRERVLELTGGVSMIPLFELRQKRIIRWVGLSDQPVAELSLDEVHLNSDGEEQVQFELEVELTPQGTEADLARIAASLQREWDLKPEQRSKFEWALALLERTPQESRLLAPQERTVCRQIAPRGDHYARRALALLALDRGATQAQAGSSAHLSERRVRYWLAQFRQRRLAVFPDRVLGEARLEVGPAPAGPSPEELPLPGPDAPPQPVCLKDLFARYSVDEGHARTVADHALVLFDQLQPLHGLSVERRPLLEISALVHNVGLETDPTRHHTAGRDILLTHPPAELDQQEGLIAALTTFLHRKRMTHRKLAKLQQSPFAALPDPVIAEALALAALVRLADGLDYSQTGSSRVGRIHHGVGSVEIAVLGPYAVMDADRTQDKSDLAHMLFGAELCFHPASPDATEGGLHLDVKEPLDRRLAVVPEEPPNTPGLRADDPMAEAARKTFYYHYQRMLYHEPGTRLGEDVEELHDMRVATRRMRAAFQMFEPHLAMRQMRPFLKGLRRTGRALGAVRDLDVFWKKTQSYLDSLPPGQVLDLSPLRSVWEAERDRARANMLAYLDSDRYAKFKDQFGALLRAAWEGTVPLITEKGEPVPHRVRHVVPVVVYQRLAAVRAYDEWVTGPGVPLERLHRLGIAAKGLRYTLEFFREALGEEAQSAIDMVKALQDHLGDLQDAVVASSLLRDFLTWRTWGHAEVAGQGLPWPTELVVAPGVAAYLSARQTELQRLLDTFPQAWTSFQGAELSQLVASAVASLL
jgi:CHAD domain-containing protein